MAIHVTRTGVALTVGIVALTAILIGGLFWVKSAGEQARRQEAITTAEQTLKDEANKDVAIGEDKDKTQSDKNQSGESSSSDKSADTNTNSSGSTSTNSTDTNTSNSSTIPQTGPGDTVITAAMIGIITFVTVGYMQSRQRA